jgi:hypothetical protein
VNKALRIVLTTVGAAAGFFILALVGLYILGSQVKARRLASASAAVVPTAPAPVANPVPSASAPNASTPTESNITFNNDATPAARATASSSPASTPFLSHFEALEAANNHADLAVEVFQNTGTYTKLQREELIAWFTARNTDSKLPSLFIIAKLHEKNGDDDEAMKWLCAAHLTAQLDGLRCTDVSARSAAPAMARQFAALAQRQVKNPDLRQRANTFALDYEESIKDRKPAAWIANHGLAAFKPGATNGSQWVTDEAWQKQRQELRATFGKQFAGK